MTRPTDAEGRRCERCHGTCGWWVTDAPPRGSLRPWEDCPACHGTGTLDPEPEDKGDSGGPCAWCKGTCERDGKPCWHCHGTGLRTDPVADQPPPEDEGGQDG